MANMLHIEVSDELLAKLQGLARDAGRSVEELCAMALEDAAPEMRDDLDDVLEGIKDADEGRTIPHEEVSAWLRSFGTPEQLPMPTCKTPDLARSR